MSSCRNTSLLFVFFCAFRTSVWDILEKAKFVMNAETIRILDSIARDRGVERELLLQDLEQAMASACRKHFNSLDLEEFGCQIDPIDGQMTLWI